MEGDGGWPAAGWIIKHRLWIPECQRNDSDTH